MMLLLMMIAAGCHIRGHIYCLGVTPKPFARLGRALRAFSFTRVPVYLGVLIFEAAGAFLHP
eukprot:5388744-Pyramimonas_sp.AAC.1